MAFQPRHAANGAGNGGSALFNEASFGLRERILATPPGGSVRSRHSPQYALYRFQRARHQRPRKSMPSNAASKPDSATCTRVAAVVNYDHFSIAPERVDPYAAMVNRSDQSLLQPRHPLRHGWFPRKARLATPSPARP